MKKQGRVAQRLFKAQRFVMCSRGDPFTLDEFIQALSLPPATACRYLGWLMDDGDVVQDADTLMYCISLSFRNFLAASANSLALMHVEGTMERNK